MHGHGIAGAFWSAVRRLAAPGTIRTTVAAIAAAAAFVVAAPKASATPVKYDYTGTDFTSVTGVYTTSDHVTGSVIFDSPLTPNMANPFTAPVTGPLPFAFTLSDGVNTISSSDAGVSLAGSEAVFVTNASDQIVSANFGGAQNTGSVPNASFKGIAIMPAGSRGLSGNTLAGSGAGQSFTTGTWTGPVSVVPPAPSLYLTVNTTGPLSNSGQRIDIAATLTLADSAPHQPNTTRLPITLPSGITTLFQAAQALGFDEGFDWTQMVTKQPDPSPLAQCASAPPCNAPGSPTIPITSSSAPYNDPPLNGYNTFVTDTNPFPFYMSLSDAVAIEQTGATLTFFDSPADYCLADTTLLGFSPAFAKKYADAILHGTPLPCGGKSNLSSAGSYLEFHTELEGIRTGFVPGFPCVGTCVDLADFDWKDNFNGAFDTGNTGTGGIAVLITDSEGALDPSSGTGGVTIVSINGQNVPEPPSLALMVSMIAALTGLRYSKRIRS